MKIADHTQGYNYNTSSSLGLPDLGNKGPQPTADADPKSEQALSLQGAIPAGWEHYNYAAQSQSGFSGTKKKR